MSRHRILFYVQYLQGVGHLYRAVNIARALASAGLDVHLASGGVLVPGLDTGGAQLHQLTAIKCRDGDFRDLTGAGGAPLDDAMKQSRRDELLTLFRQVRPHALIIEAFPFGRRQMRFELLPLLDEARSASPRPLVICSVRDILQASGTSGRVRETVDMLNTQFDRVLVHGDPNFIPLAASFEAANEIADKLHYTGLVADPSHAAPATRGGADGEVLVSAGGGGTRSERLLEAAIAARPLTRAGKRPWRLLAGPNLPDDRLAELHAQVPEGVTLEPNRKDFAALLAECAVSVSQAGYNTVVDLLRCGCRSVLVPYSEQDQSEQSFRARRLGEMGLAQVVKDAALSPETLARAIEAALERPPPGPAKIDLGGARKSADLVTAWLK